MPVIRCDYGCNPRVVSLSGMRYLCGTGTFGVQFTKPRTAKQSPPVER